MARYHLNIRHHGRLYRDDEGENIPSEIEMKVRALETAHDLIGTPSFTIPDWLACTLEVTNEAGETVLVLPFTEAVEEV
jgi:hypothetical protein